MRVQKAAGVGKKIPLLSVEALGVLLASLFSLVGGKLFQKL